MKVALINGSANGSTGNICRSIKNALEKRGDECHFYYGFGSISDANTYRIEGELYVHFHALMSKLTGLQSHFSIIPTIKLIRQLKTFQPDVVHFHNLHGSYINIGFLFKYLRNENIRVIGTLHDCWLFTGKCPYFTVVNCEKWKNSCGNCPQLSRYPASFFFDKTQRNLKEKETLCDSLSSLEITTVSEWLLRCTKQSFLGRHRVVRIYNGIDLTRFYPDEDYAILNKYNIPNKHIILGVASVWSDRKGLVDFIELSKLLNKNEIVVLVGLSTEQISCLPENVCGLNQAEDYNDLRKLYSVSKVLINYSMEETFGLVTAEALACGTPAIVFNSSACPEVVDDKTGIVLNNKTTENVYAAVQKIIYNSELYRREECVRRISESFNQETMIRRYCSLYDEK